MEKHESPNRPKRYKQTRYQVDTHGEALIVDKSNVREEKVVVISDRQAKKGNEQSKNTGIVYEFVEEIFKAPKKRGRQPEVKESKAEETKQD